MDKNDLRETSLNAVIEVMKKYEPDPDEERAYEAIIKLISDKHGIPVEKIKEMEKLALAKRFAEIDTNTPICDGNTWFSTKHNIGEQ